MAKRYSTAQSVFVTQYSGGIISHRVRIHQRASNSDGSAFFPAVSGLAGTPQTHIQALMTACAAVYLSNVTFQVGGSYFPPAATGPAVLVYAAGTATPGGSAGVNLVTAGQVTFTYRTTGNDRAKFVLLDPNIFSGIPFKTSNLATIDARWAAINSELLSGAWVSFFNNPLFRLLSVSGTYNKRLQRRYKI